MAITASQVKELRDKTNAGMMECKGALKETDGDIDAAIKYLRERGSIKAAKKADREAKEGLVTAQLPADGKSGVLLELNCETDFVARNDNFGSFLNDLATAAAASDATDLASFLTSPFEGVTVDEATKGKVIELGENLQISRLERFDVAGEGAIASYLHMGGKVGVLLEVSCEKGDTPSQETFKELVKDITLHIAAAAPVRTSLLTSCKLRKTSSSSKWLIAASLRTFSRRLSKVSSTSSTASSASWTKDSLRTQIPLSLPSWQRKARSSARLSLSSASLVSQ